MPEQHFRYYRRHELTTFVADSAAIELTDVPPAQPEQEPPAGCPSEQGSGKAEHDDNYPHGWKLASLFLALFLAVLCIGLV